MTESTKTPKPKRRWLRFSLRNFLIVLTIFCIWLGWYLHRVEQQREAVKWVVENGGTVYYDYQFDRKLRPQTERQPPVPKWLYEMLGINYFSSVIFVTVYKTQISDLTPLVAFKKLRWLTAEENTHVSDLTPLADLTSLEMLVLHKTNVSDLTPLAHMEKLQGLYLSDTQVCDLTPLAGLTKLKELSLDGTLISDATPLAGLTNLEELWICVFYVSDEEIRKLQLALPNCKFHKFDRTSNDLIFSIYK